MGVTKLSFRDALLPFFEEMKKIDPDCDVLISTGNIWDVDTEKLSNSGCRGFIEKPFRFEYLKNKIKSIFRP